MATATLPPARKKIVVLRGDDSINDDAHYSDASSSLLTYRPTDETEMVDFQNVKNVGYSKPEQCFPPIRPHSSSSSCASSKRSLRRRDVIKPVVLPVSKESNDRALAVVTRPIFQWGLPAQNLKWVDPDGFSGGFASPYDSFRGIDPSEVVRGHSGDRDPPGECSDISRPPYDESTGDVRNRFRNVQWVDPKSVDEEDIDYSVIQRYCSLARDSFVPYVEPPRRIRIATISSGYKTANFFVREDLDQRIYFHDLEDAVSYMARRGYARMEKGEEREWMKLLSRAHQVVKIGPNKKKQRYRKGKLVLIMSKPIVENTDHYSDVPKYTDASEATTHTSLGRSIRCGYKSYSEKFLAEQEYERRRTLLMLTNGEDGSLPSSGAFLQLTNGVRSLSVVDEGKSQSSSNESNASDARRGVYGGGVRYFTPDKSYDDDESDESSETDRDEEDDALEVMGSDMGSMLSSEEFNLHDLNNGVESVDSSTIESGRVNKSIGKCEEKDTKNKRRAPTPFDKTPEMMMSSDDSQSSSSWDKQ